VNIPVLGKFLFGSEHKDQLRGDLMIALIPHIVRTPDYTAENLRGIYAGTDQVVKINYASPPAPAPLAPGAAVSPLANPLGNPAAVPATAPGGSARVSFAPANIQAAPGATVTVRVQVDDAANIAAVSPLRIKYDPKVLRLDDIVPGDWFSRGGAPATVLEVTSVKDIRNDTGEASITINRPTVAPAAAASGTLAVLTFTATGNGESPVTISELGLKDAQAAPVPAVSTSLGVRIQ
jgi:general secretion pathway protein D